MPYFGIMKQMPNSAKKVSILIPNYKTPVITKLCLRLLRKYTPADLAEVIVIDNQSQDASIEYLRTLKWITLIERQTVPGETGPQAHVRALDCGLAAASCPYILSIHTDTFVRRPDWLPYLIQQIESRENIAGVGSWKLEEKSWWQLGAKKCEEIWQQKILHKKPEERFLRSHCALYKRSVMDQLGLCFSNGSSTAGLTIHQKCVEAGFDMRFLSEQTLVQYMVHANHATMVLNPELGAANRTISRGLRRIEQTLQDLNSSEILSDSTLDY
jgi:hypothetical protein